MTKIQKYIAIPVLGALILTGGAIAGYANMASAQTAETGSSTQAQGGVVQAFDHLMGGHVGKNGMKEEVLTGDLAAQATAAAQAAVPGATVERVETDAEGAAYEAHMTKSDGSRVTIKFDTNFNVTGTEEGHGK